VANKCFNSLTIGQKLFVDPVPVNGQSVVQLVLSNWQRVCAEVQKDLTSQIMTENVINTLN